MDRFINVRLLSNPFNWVTVTLMVVIGGLALAHISISANTAGD